MRFAWMVQPRNYLLLACHASNETVQMYQFSHWLKHQGRVAKNEVCNVNGKAIAFFGLLMKLTRFWIGYNKIFWIINEIKLVMTMSICEVLVCAARFRRTGCSSTVPKSAKSWYVKNQKQESMVVDDAFSSKWRCSAKHKTFP
ncbi:putative mitochondrial pyruvate carrier [Helianthus annuus]|uniref:Mitochondrial pyruvate carrier n=2 Tax=Helianthus annuus TaxID=4232 RepID=A0A9K3J8J7_HELAN|nr:putative mitochondrial pyruvate carrier [Helianthus annuus]KAJ0931490.1 putative mitochondrial pyruvate carrier [Helianthus annuus]